ncbi:MAG TPA: outer membrane lipoprotein carrier protein LolA [Legionellales bacterium]|nr:outer membrane lipoprotein carrier protein LolA [Legionellales bacterium]
MKLFLSLSLFLLTSFALALPAHNQLIQMLEAIKTLDAQFNQTVTMNGRRVSESNGHFSLKKPGQLNWTIQKPQQQIMIADGQTVWVYEPKIQQATRRPQKAGVGGTAGLFVSSQPNLWVARYRVTSQSNGQTTIFQLVSKNQKNSLAKVKLFFEANRLEKIEFWDQLGQYSQISLSRVKVNQTLSSRLFYFSPPKNVDVIDLR